MLKKTDYEGSQVPRGYRIACWNYDHRGDSRWVAYPYPLNWIAGAIRWVCEFYQSHLRDFPGCNTPFMQILDKRYDLGKERGYKRGYEIGYAMAKADIRRKYKAAYKEVGIEL